MKRFRREIGEVAKHNLKKAVGHFTNGQLFIRKIL